MKIITNNERGVLKIKIKLKKINNNIDVEFYNNNSGKD